MTQQNIFVYKVVGQLREQRFYNRTINADAPPYVVFRLRCQHRQTLKTVARNAALQKHQTL